MDSRIVLLGVFACALFYGDSMITPAISVLSAVEGLQTIEPRFGPFVVPVAIIILTGLFRFSPMARAASEAFLVRSCCSISRRYRYSVFCTLPTTCRSFSIP